MKAQEGYYEDRFGNRWNMDKFTLLEAVAAADTLSCCSGCTDCVYCTHCVHCEQCRDCIHCYYCSGCRSVSNKVNRHTGRKTRLTVTVTMEGLAHGRAL